MQKHTLLLVQSSKHNSTRFYQDYGGLEEAMEGLIKMMETRLRELNPTAKTFTYDVSALLAWVDDLKELLLLSYDEELKAYKSYTRTWVKQQLQDHLAALAQPAAPGNSRPHQQQNT